MAANSKVYEGDMLGNAGGPFIAVAESLKQFVSHEIGHNMVSANQKDHCTVLCPFINSEGNQL